MTEKMDNENIQDKQDREQYSSMVNHNTILLSFEGWIKYIEGFTRGLQTTKTVDASSVMDCIGEVLEYMQTLRVQVFEILQHCEGILEQNTILTQINKELEIQMKLKLLPALKATEEVKEGEK